MNITELLKLKSENGIVINYSDLLQLDEWIFKRKEILTRDNDKCSICDKEKTHVIFGGNQKMFLRIDNGKPIWEEEEISLEVHHKFYIRNLLPWEYEDALITVCNKCHKEIHKSEKIPIYFDESKNQKIITDTCKKCGGTGFLPEYDYYKGGVCFRCQGTGMEIPWEKR